MTENTEVRNLSAGFDVSQESRFIKGYGVIFNKESNLILENVRGVPTKFYEVVKPEAITEETLRQSDIKVYLNHDRQRGLLARSKQGEGSLQYSIDERGVIYEFDAPKTQLGDEVLEGLKRADYSESSFAFTVTKDRWLRREDQTLLREILKVDKIYDFSIVENPAYNETYVSTAQRSLEAFLETEEVQENKVTDEVTEPINEAREDQQEEIKEEVQEEIIEAPKDQENTTEINQEERQTTNKSNNKTMENFKILDVIKAQVNGKELNERANDIIAQGRREASFAEAGNVGKYVIPMKEERANIVAGVAGAGKEIVPTDKLDLIKPLYANSVLLNAGAKFYGNLKGNLSLPVYGGSTVSWKGEAVDAADGAGATSEITLSPKRLTAYITVSEQILLQESVDLENSLKEDLMKALMDKLEATVLGNAAGSATQPAGILNGVTAMTTDVTYADIIGMETALEEANVKGEKVFIVAPKSKAALRNTKVDAGSGKMVFEAGETLGYRTLVSSNVSGKGVIMGDFSNYAIAQWGGIEITAEPKRKNGTIEIVVSGYFDAKPLRDNSIQTKILK